MRARRATAPLIATAVVGLASTLAAGCAESEAAPTSTEIAGDTLWRDEGGGPAGASRA